MQMKSLIANHISSEIRNHEDAMHAVIEFVKIIPIEVLESDFDPIKPERRSYVDGNTVYKFGIYPEPNVVFVEVYDEGEQTPKMSLCADDEEKYVSFSGKSADKRFTMKFFVSDDGIVENTMELE